MDKKKVSELAKQVRGVSYKPEDLHDSLDNNSVILLRANNINDGKINFEDVVYVDKSKVSKEQYLCKGDILICASSGSKQLVGKAASVDFDIECTFGAFCKVVRPNSDIADYLGTYFQSNSYRQKISEVAIGANINNIRNEHIDGLVVSVGTDEENAEVVRIMTSIKKIIDGRKQELQKLDELVKARFVEMINEEESFPIKLKDIVKGDRIITYGMVKPGNDVEGGVIIIKVKDFPNGIIRTDDFLHSDPVLEAKYARSRVKEGDLLYSIRGTVGRTAFVTKELEGANITQDTARLSVDAKRYDANYVRYALGYDSVRIEIEKQIKGVAMKGISLSELREIEIPCVDYEKQVAFGMFVKQLDKSKVVIQKALDETQVLFNSLMQKYFG